MDSKPLTRRECRAAAAYRKLVKLKERASADYERADRQALKLATLIGGHGKTVRISAEGKAIEVVDNYQAAIAHPKRKPDQMPKAWAHGCVRQFDFEELKSVAQ